MSPAFDRTAACLLALVLLAACSRRADEPPVAGTSPAASRPSILLVTLDTTRADAVAPEAPEEVTPHLAHLAARGRRFRQAYATAPMTLPAHASLFTGLYPSEHGVHENGRTLASTQPLVAEALRAAGYDTGAFVSAFVLDRQCGLARGFAHYDDDLGGEGRDERSAAETTDRAIAWLARPRASPVFLWVHYYDAHAPYSPPEPFRSRFASDRYRGEVAAVDAQIGRLLAAFAARAGHAAPVLVVGDHGEALGEHGEPQHGMLLYQGVVRVPLIVTGPRVAAGDDETPVSARRVRDTLLAWAGLGGKRSLTAPGPGAGEPVLAEAMHPYLSYGWQPQVMAVHGRWKAIHAGSTELYDLMADPAEGHDLAGGAPLERELRAALRDYPLPAVAAGEGGLDDETRRRLAALGYASSSGPPRLRPDAPAPRAMTAVFADLELASGLFAREHYAEAAPVFSRVLARDPRNPMVAVQLAVCHSLLGHDAEALRWFARAQAMDPGSPELRHYLGLHYLRSGDWQRAEPLLTAAVAAMPDRLTALEGLAEVRKRQGRPGEAAALLQRVVDRKSRPEAELLRLGELRMATGETAAAIAAFERARELQGDGFRAHLQLGVCYLAAGRYAEARDSLERVPATGPDRPLALFKRAQVSVLLGEPDRRDRIRAALAAADESTRPLIERERLFDGLR